MLTNKSKIKTIIGADGKSSIDESKGYITRIYDIWDSLREILSQASQKDIDNRKFPREFQDNLDDLRKLRSEMLSTFLAGRLRLPLTIVSLILDNFKSFTVLHIKDIYDFVQLLEIILKSAELKASCLEPSVSITGEPSASRLRHAQVTGLSQAIPEEEKVRAVSLRFNLLGRLELLYNEFVRAYDREALNMLDPRLKEELKSAFDRLMDVVRNVTSGLEETADTSLR